MQECSVSGDCHPGSPARRGPLQPDMLVIATIVLPLLSVGLHYELLVLASAAVRILPGSGRADVVLAVLLALVAHVLEVVVFGLGWFVLIRAGVVELSLPSPTLVETIYFSGSVYTSLGFGDIVPVNSGRFLVVIEAVTGLVLIAWTASFTFYQMRERWMDDGGEEEEGG